MKTNYKIYAATNTLNKRIASECGFISRQWRKVIDTRLKAFELTNATWMPLITLAKAGRPMCQKELAESLLLDTSSIVRTLNNLRDLNLIRWSTDENDRRAKVIVVTQEGMSLTKSIVETSKNLEAEVLEGISPEEIEVARNVLKKIAEKILNIASRL